MSTPKNSLTSAGLALLLGGQILPVIDFSIVNVALESIAASLDANHVELELMVAVYGVFFAVCLAMGGRLGDRYGRRTLMSIGVLIFGVSSLACGLAPNMLTLLIARAVQGVGAAMMVPQILSTIHVCLTGRSHSRALGYYSAIGGLSFVTGQVLGGWLVSADLFGLGWRNVFLVNIPVCLLILSLSGSLIPNTFSEKASSVDKLGTTLLAAAILCLLIPVSLGPLFEWSWPLIAVLMMVIPLFILLWKAEQRIELKGSAPLIPPRLLRLRSIQFGLVLCVLFVSCWSGYMFSVALTLQSGLGLTPLQSGNTFIGMGLCYFVGSLISARVTAVFGQMNTLLLGCGIQIPGLLGLIISFHWFWPTVQPIHLLAATMLIGFGQSFIVSSFFRISLSEVPAEDAGSGSAMLTTVQQSAFGLGAALLGTVMYEVLKTTDNYLAAITGALVTEIGIMIAVVILALIYRSYLKRRAV
ncbi:MFS transporter [Neptunomonas phycophila]|uniref:MFS transporter n=1 Tax=Neptunomonas phycophila TaxID=1572645 RepID=A0ABT9ETJ8_9GAMM|nr:MULTISPECIES: MFS transporter [Neptunomonas]MDN2659242.1 MFS transporter [Neptunomonas sp. CHC150]MDP2522398.1 MFS transporter [Neptunomonas phycophila]